MKKAKLYMQQNEIKIYLITRRKKLIFFSALNIFMDDELNSGRHSIFRFKSWGGGAGARGNTPSSNNGRAHNFIGHMNFKAILIYNHQRLRPYLIMAG